MQARAYYFNLAPCLIDLAGIVQGILGFCALSAKTSYYIDPTLYAQALETAGEGH